MAGFRRAHALGCPMVECDVRVSADRALVLAHDPHVTDPQGRTWHVTDETAATLAGLNLGAGEGVLTLDTLVAWAAESGVSVMVDMKAEGNGVEERVAAILSALPPAQKIVPGASAAARRRFRTLDPNLPLSLSLGRGDVPDDAAFARLLPEIDTNAVTWEWPLLTPERIAALHGRGLFVFAWTVRPRRDGAACRVRRGRNHLQPG
jgi:glycerophosphoryl diester phosphodiesterase